MITREAILSSPRRPPVAVTVAGQEAWLRYPTFGQWRAIMLARQGDKPVSAEDAARAVVVLLVDADGQRLFADSEWALLLAADPSIVTGLYATAWKTVLEIEDDKIEAAKGE
ncbi:hypothetical protein UFOVP1124_14 [uncultured Caudovirales phage]|uniref:Uncharacterized protein n=1 Tax=uncultured Caudovirales phage TaxID=2100421 RepID=A0A6J5QJG5_9CAUD|nr:hypothetical protein UFOVP1124_14 [uncultured Caudovirales phage]